MGAVLNPLPFRSGSLVVLDDLLPLHLVLTLRSASGLGHPATLDRVLRQLVQRLPLTVPALLRPGHRRHRHTTAHHLAGLLPDRGSALPTPG